MKSIISLLAVVFFFSCANEKKINLPQIHQAQITTLTDVSAAYLFYDNTQADSVFLNRKNLISTTNWLINVDKRLSLRQVLPHIQFLQDKKRKASHTNKNAKNYFTCHDLATANLGFIEFTPITYHFEKAPQNPLKKNWPPPYHHKPYTSPHNAPFHEEIWLLVSKNGNLQLEITSLLCTVSETLSSIKDLPKLLLKYSDTNALNIHLKFNPNLSFQSYISIKAQLQQLDPTKFRISPKEYILN
jgi:hypothetical protein